MWRHTAEGLLTVEGSPAVEAGGRPGARDVTGIPGKLLLLLAGLLSCCRY